MNSFKIANTATIVLSILTILVSLAAVAVFGYYAFGSNSGPSFKYNKELSVAMSDAHGEMMMARQIDYVKLICTPERTIKVTYQQNAMNRQIQSDIGCSGAEKDELLLTFGKSTPGTSQTDYSVWSVIDVKPFVVTYFVNLIFDEVLKAPVTERMVQSHAVMPLGI